MDGEYQASVLRAHDAHSGGSGHVRVKHHAAIRTQALVDGPADVEANDVKVGRGRARLIAPASPVVHYIARCIDQDYIPHCHILPLHTMLDQEEEHGPIICFDSNREVAAIAFIVAPFVTQAIHASQIYGEVSQRRLAC